MTRAATGPAPAGRGRIASIDVVRGLAMVVMVLDHTRDFAHRESFLFSPTDLDQASPDIFLTRWITHFVAPIFVLLAGTAARLQVDGRRGRAATARFLVIRGLLLVLLELTVVRVGIWFNVDPSFLGLLQVIWVLGVSMIVLAGLLFLPDPAVAMIGLALIIGHNALDGVRAPADVQLPWAILHERANLAVLSSQQPDLFVLYPLIPWIGVMAIGYALGRLYRPAHDPNRRTTLIALGIATTAAWIALRAINGYGDPIPWQSFGDPARTAMSFLNAEKYPPSLAFLTMTLGPSLVLLGLLDRTGAGAPAGRRTLAGRTLAPIGRWLTIFGTVPLFFYLLQWYVAHGLALLAEAVAGQDVAWHFMTPPARFSSVPPEAGFPLPVVYLLWVVAIVILYPLCRWYRDIRLRRGGVYRYL